jgi:hypothetical protein
MNETELTPAEKRTIAALRRLAQTWPGTLVLFAGGTGLSVRKPKPGEFYGKETEVAFIPGIMNDGGDGGDI